jgi:hypothetical protein
METEENQSALVPKIYTVLMETIMKNNGKNEEDKKLRVQERRTGGGEK